jgi:transcriptional regulator with XRE-family HTH domain
MQNMQIVKQLETYRLEKRLSLQNLADDLGVSFSTVSRWFSGKTNPSKIQQYHIEKFLNDKIKRAKR